MEKKYLKYKFLLKKITITNFIFEKYYTLINLYIRNVIKIGSKIYMKILILARDIPPYVCVPGAIQRVILFCKYLADRGYEVGLVGSTRQTTNYEGPIWWNEELDIIKVFPLVPGKILRYIDFVKEELRKNKPKKMNLYEYQDEIMLENIQVK